MTPYYEHAGITIYHGDCGDVVEDLAPHFGEKLFSLLLTDPPYGVDGVWAANPSGGLMTKQEAVNVRVWDECPDPRLLKSLIGCCRYSIIWGGNYLADILGRTRAPLIWDKGQRGMHFADGEMAWTNFDWGTLRIFAMRLVDGDTKGTGVRLHPTQKPEEVMSWSIRQAKEARTIFDPFMGSGSTLVAAKRLGLECVGIEREEKYCEIAARRLSQETLPLEFAEDPTPTRLPALLPSEERA